MNRIDKAFRSLRRAGKPAFVAYITAGDPSLSWTRRLVESLDGCGVDIVELGVPFSDPLADGIVNQRAAQRALASGTTLFKILHCVSQIRKQIPIPVVLFSYFNPIHKMGVEVFARKAAKAGVDGVLILDAPPEESQEARRALHRQGLKMIYLVAPTTGNRRIQKICRVAGGFLYCVSRTGVTGAQESVLAEVRALVRRVKKKTKLPVVVGFGVSKPGHVRALGNIADGVVVGSALVSEIEKHPANPVPALSRIVRGLTKALDVCHG